MPPKSLPIRSSRTSKSGPLQSGRENINITLNVDDTTSKGGTSKGAVSNARTNGNQTSGSPQVPPSLPPKPSQPPTPSTPPKLQKLFQAPVDSSVNVNVEKLQTDQPISQGTLSLLTSTSSEVPSPTTTTITTAGSSLPDLSLQNQWANDKKKTTWIIVGCCLGAAVVIAIVVTVLIIKKKKRKKKKQNE